MTHSISASIGCFTLFALVLLTTAFASGVTQRVLYNFQGGTSGGATPDSKLVVGPNGHLFGTTTIGGNQTCSGGGCGTVFELAPKAGGGWNYHTLYFFKDGQDGAFPVGNIVFDAAGNLYGATFRQGAHGRGAVYELTPTGTGRWTERIIYSFQGFPDGDTPYSGVTIDAAGNLYGTTNSGGANGVGSVYKLAPNSDGSFSETVIHSFAGGTDGEYTWAEPAFDAAGNLYGTTVWGGTYNLGTVYRLTPASDGTWTETVLYSFTGQADQGIPKAAVWVDAAGNIFGTASDDGEPGAGTVFELSPNSGGTYTQRTLHTFGAVGDGYRPYSALTPDAAGNLYGTTYVGGTAGGCVYRLEPGANGTWTEHVVYDFTGGNDGNAPQVTVTVGSGGVLYGVTPLGGTSNMGVVYAIKP